MPNDKAKELTARELIALERGNEIEPVATCKDYLQVQNEPKPCPYCNGEYVNSPDGHYVHPFNDCHDRGRILQTDDIAWFNHRPIEEALQEENAELKARFGTAKQPPRRWKNDKANY